jgi:hypothetical protein
MTSKTLAGALLGGGRAVRSFLRSSGSNATPPHAHLPKPQSAPWGTYPLTSNTHASFAARALVGYRGPVEEDTSWYERGAYALVVAAAAFANVGTAECARPPMKEPSGRVQDMEAYADAVAWCKANKKGAKAAVNSGSFPLVTSQKLHNRLKKKVDDMKYHEGSRILTEEEECQLVDWMLRNSDGNAAPPKDQVDVEIVRMLGRRHAYRAHTGWRKGTPLSQPALKVLNSANVNKNWHTKFARKWAAELDFDPPVAEDSSRVAKQTEKTVQAHFYAPAGLEACLKKHGIMDPVTGRIDTSRVINWDETPQFLDFGANKGGGKTTFYGRKGQKQRKSTTVNRECNTIDCCWGMDGWAYGLHVIVARTVVNNEWVSDDFKRSAAWPRASQRHVSGLLQPWRRLLLQPRRRLLMRSLTLVPAHESQNPKMGANGRDGKRGQRRPSEPSVGSRVIY